MNTTAPTLATSGRRIAALTTGLIAVVTVSLAAPSVSAAAPTSSRAGVQSDTTRERLQAACARIPDVEQRIKTLIGIIQGDATVRGSLAWLQAKIDQATAAGRTDLVTLLENRVATREQRLVLLQTRQRELTALREFCAAKGFAG